MDEMGYLVPANAKRSSLIFSMFRGIDLAILGVSVGISLIFLIALGATGTLMLVVACIPMAIGILLVLPIPNYHNTLVLLQSIMDYYFNNRRKFIWKGWCVMDEYQEK